MKKVIKMTESQLKRIVKNTVNEQVSTDYFNVLKNAGDTVEPDKDGETDYRQVPWGEKTILRIRDDGQFVLYTKDSPDFKPAWFGKMVIVSDNSYKLIYDNGDVYRSDINKDQSNDNKLYSNCAESLDNIKEDNFEIIKYGCKNNAVKELQKLLGMEEKYHTGYFGKITRGKVIEFQKTHKDSTGSNLKPDGIVGFKTYQSLISQVKPTEGDTDTNTSVDNNVESDFVNENYNEYYNDSEDYNELDSLFDKNFNTEDDYDGEMFRGDDEGFSNKMRQNQIHKKMRLSSTGLDTYYKGGGDLKSNTIPRDEEGKEVKWSPIRDNEMPLDKYLEKKKMSNLDEDEDISMLDSLFDKDEINEQTSSYDKIKAEWSKVNSDNDTSTKGFGEGKSQDQSLAMQMAEFNARMIVGKKSMGMKPSDTTPFKGSVSASEVDGKMYKMGNTYVYLCLMDKN